ncbi:uncharacterized protein LOC135173167 [Diachasmimorpha longicaudata]|uniref:uncharacterized protein LOC135173167 n=1 Tax=Diachasmimorpha longicaudata TaxID=58733 RepID=UPI0030B8BD91
MALRKAPLRLRNIGKIQWSGNRTKNIKNDLYSRIRRCQRRVMCHNGLRKSSTPGRLLFESHRRDAPATRNIPSDNRHGSVSASISPQSCTRSSSVRISNTTGCVIPAF